MKNLVVNGCSFTQANKNQQKWPDFVVKNICPDSYYNIAQSGAGNKYICDSTINFLESNNLVPAETTVLIMWSGIGRKDLHISGEWFFHLKETYTYLCQKNNESYFLHSGGLANSWMQDKQLEQVFSPQYKLSDPLSICIENLLFFIQLRSYLRERKYNFYFTNYFNTWNKNIESTNGGDYCIANFCVKEDLPLYNKFDFDDWFFVDTEKNCLGDLAHDMNELDHTGHPTTTAYEKFAQQVVIPLLT